MTREELEAQRRARWRIAGNPVRTEDDARDFIESVGLCLAYPVRPPRLLPTLIGATLGSDERLPLQKQAFGDERAATANDLMVRLLRSKAAFETGLFGETPLLVARSVFPYYYGVAGDKAPKVPPRGRGHEASPLAVDVFNLLDKKGPLTKNELRERLGGSISDEGITRTLHDLWAKLKITRIGYTEKEGSSWDVLHRWASNELRQGIKISVPEGLSALISKYVDAMIAAEQREIEDFFSVMVPRSRVTDVVRAMLASRQFHIVTVGGKNMVALEQIAPPEFVREPEEEEQRPAFREQRPSFDRPPRREGRTDDRGPRREGDRPPRREGERKSFAPRPPRREGEEGKRFGPRPPRREDSRPPRREGDRPPRREGDRPQREGGFRPPRREGEEGKRFGSRPPRREDSRPPRRGGDRPPREGGFRPPRREGEEGKRFGSRPPRREGSRPPRPEADRPQREGGFRPPRREGEEGKRFGARPPRGEGSRPPRREFGKGSRPNRFGSAPRTGRPAPPRNKPPEPSE